MSSNIPGRGVISHDRRALLRGNTHRSAYGWEFHEHLVPETAVLKNLQLDAYAARERHLKKIIARCRGDVSVSYVDESDLHNLPATYSFAQEVAHTIGSRVLSAQFNFYGPGSELLGHNDGPNTDPESTLVLSISGRAVFDILPDIGLGYADSESMDVIPGDAVFLSPITSRDPKMYTSRRHAVRTNTDTTRVSLVAAFV
jgi:hypothetical protein